uniref:GB1/RHD3-type G domain-containing protein n=1 Tax=Astyanax mexicanus TaxID=7994 RepID=A0A8B9GT04_ASTMX
MEGPVCLISTDSEGQLSVQKEAKDILDGITSPVVVVSVVGLYRTGKSYLMNRLAGKQRGFALGSTIESKTKGIWMWCVPHPHKKEHTLVLLDTEGLGDIDKGDEKHDTWVFCLAVLLSSTLVYNSLGVIDNMALEKLHYVTELTENIRVKARKGSDEDESAEFMRIFPSFIWSVRDFTLELKKDNRDITADQYLETALELKTGSSAKVNNYNLPRSCLRNFFAERRCFVFRRPAADEDLRRMEELTEEELEPEFLKQTQEFCNYVFSNTKPKTLTGGRTLSGTVLGSLAEVYVEAIRSGRVPCLENAVEALAQIQNGRAVEQAMQAYLTEVLDSACFPLDPAKLSDIHTQAERKAVEVFIMSWPCYVSVLFCLCVFTALLFVYLLHVLCCVFICVSAPVQYLHLCFFYSSAPLFPLPRCSLFPFQPCVCIFFHSCSCARGARYVQSQSCPMSRLMSSPRSYTLSSPLSSPRSSPLFHPLFHILCCVFLCVSAPV